MRYLIQSIVMITELIILAAVIVAGYLAFHFQSPVCLVVFFGGILAWNETGIFFSWRPSNIRKFMANAKKAGL